MEKGWDAKGKLEPLWSRLPGKRDELATLTGIRGTTLSAYNSGKRPLGLKNATLIADALNVSLYDLGAPKPNDSDFIVTMLGQLTSELARNPPQDPGRLRVLANEFRSLADVLEAVADSLADGVPLAP